MSNRKTEKAMTGAVWGAVLWDVYWAVDKAVDWALEVEAGVLIEDGALWVAVGGAAEDPPHPAFQAFLREAQ